jgi:hypothetical protein
MGMLGAACALGLTALAAAPAQTTGCEDCHGDRGLLLRDRKLYDDYRTGWPPPTSRPA